MTMGNIIRKLRKEKNLTQDELAELLNVTPQAVSRWENETGLPDITQVVPLANAFGVSTDTLFGMVNQSADNEIEEFIPMIEKKIANTPENVSEYSNYLEAFTLIQEKLKVYPNNYRLIAYSLGIVNWIHELSYGNDFSNEIKDRDFEKAKWENEFFREANLILNHCTESKYLDEANAWMASFYERMNNLEKAEEYAKKLPSLNVFTDRANTLSHIYFQTERFEEAKKLLGESVFTVLYCLQQHLFTLGCLFKREGKYEDAYSCYKLYPEIYELIMSGKDEVPYCIEPGYSCCSLICMTLGRHDEAMDWLEKYLNHERFVTKNYNVITKTKLPYFYGTDWEYSEDTYTPDEKITNFLKRKDFDPIRGTDRFKSIVTDAEAFENGN